MATAGKIACDIEETQTQQAATGAPNVSDVRSVALLFEESAAGRSGADFAPRAAGELEAAAILGPALCRDDIPGFPELSEPQVMRHFLRLSQLNFGQALQFYPLGSCTMKYNPVLNDEMAALAGFAALHPLTPAHLAAGALELMASAGGGARRDNRDGRRVASSGGRRAGRAYRAC